MLKDSRRWIGLAFAAVTVFDASLLLSGGVAQAHGKHAPSPHQTEAQMKVDQVTSGQHSQCHGGAFCNGPAIILHSMADPVLDKRSEGYGLPQETRAMAVACSFDPPPPRILV